MIDLEMLDKINNILIKKPNGYHYTCGGGSAIPLIDTWGFAENFDCRFKGDKNWMTPACEKCDGKLHGCSELNDWQRAYNQGLNDLYCEIKRAIEANRKE